MLTLLFALALAAQPVTLVREPGAFRLTGWEAPAGSAPEDWASIFQVYVGGPDAPAVLGSYEKTPGGLLFRPRYAIAPNVPVRAVFNPPGAERVETAFLPEASTRKATTEVSAVYPSSNELPANLLKFYVHFSAPMQRGDAWQHIHLLDSAGKTVDLAFLEIDQELWDRELRRLTVLFDPGRIKRGVLPREEAGKALEPGGRYTLVVDENWRDAQGLRLRAGFRKPFRVVAEDRTPFNAAQWKLTVPGAGTRHPLQVDLPEPADRALLERMLRVECGGTFVAGLSHVANEEKTWQFAPEAAWKAGECRLQVDTNLEDLAGNRVGRAFDVDVFEEVTKKRTTAVASVPFRIGSQ